MSKERKTNSTNREKASGLEEKEKKIAQKAEKKRARMEKKANRKPMKKGTKAFLIGFFGLICAGILTCCILGIKMVTYVVSYKNGPVKIDLDIYKSQQYRTSVLYATNEDGKKIEMTRLHGAENREWVDYKNIPKNLRNSFVFAEDKRFYDHHGVDWLRTAAVFVRNNKQGGSTITQQLIKNLTGKNEVTYVRKFNEICQALNLEENYTKEDIIEAYLNTVYLGAGCYGVKTAAETYFGKDLDELTVAECALIAGQTKNPYANNPYVNMENAIIRQQYVLKCLWENGKINEKTYKKALKYDIEVLPKKAITDGGTAEINSYYVDFVIDDVIANLVDLGYESSEATQMVYCGGLQIETAVDMRVQKSVEEIYENRKGFEYASKDKYGQLPDSAITIMDYQGRVVAIVGGTGKKTANRVKNRASTSYRQPGSSIKPLTVYAPSIDMGYITSGSTTILDKAITLPNGQIWPKNYNGDHGSGQNVTVNSAVYRSLNTVPARIVYEILGIEKSYEYATKVFHLKHLTAKDKDLSPLAVGGTNGGVSTLEMAAAYACFGNGGRYYKPYSFYRVIDRDGNVIIDNTTPKWEQAIQESAADKMLTILTGVTTNASGTAYGCGVSGLQTYAKTGTTTDNYDKWICCGTPYYVCSIWYGYNMPSNLYGSSSQVKSILKTVYNTIHKDLSRQRTFETVKSELGE